MVSSPFDSPSEVQVAVGGDASGMNSALDGAMAKLSNFKGAVAAASAAAGALAAGGMAASIDAAADFDAAMTESLAIMGDVTETMEEDMAGAAREVAQQTTFSAEQAAESYFFLASAGMDAQESMQSLPEVAEFAQAGMFDMAEATDILTDAQSALGEQNVELAELSDMLVAANQNANASVEQFGTALTNKAAPAMRRMNVETEEGVAALSVFADQGLKGRRAGTILARTLTGLESNARENSEAFEELGVQVTNSNGEMRPMQDIIADMETAFAGMSTGARQAAMEQLGFNRRTSQGLDLLIGNSEQLGTYEENLRESGGAAEEVANNQLDTLSAQWQLLKSDITDIAISIGQVLLPPLSDLLSEVSVAADQFQTLNEKTDGMAGAAGLAATAVGGLAVALGTVSAPILAIVAGMGTLAAAWSQNWGNIRQITQEAAEFIRQTTEEFLEFVTQLWDEHGEELTESVEQLTSFIGDVWARFGDDIVRILQDALDLLVAIVEPALNNVLEAFDLITDALAGDWEGVWESMVSMVQTSIDGITGIIEASISLVSDAIGAWIDAIRAPFEALWDFLVGNSLVPDLFDEIPRIIRDAIPSIDGAVGMVKGAVVGVFEDMKEAVTGIAGDMMDGVADTIDDATPDINEAAKQQTEAAQERYEEWNDEMVGNSIIPDMMDDIVAEMRSATPRIVSVVDTATTRLADLWEQAQQDVSTAADGVIQSIDEMEQRISDAQMGPGGFGTPPGRNDGGGGGGGDDSGGSGGDDGGGSGGGGGGGGGEGTDPPRKDRIQKQAREIQRAFEGPGSLQKLSMEEAANQFDGLRSFLKRVGGQSLWDPTIAGGFPPGVEFTDEDIKKHQRKRFSQLTGEFQVPAEWIRLAVDPPFSDPNYAPAGQEVISNVPGLDAGGAIRSGGRAMLHAGERVLPEAQVSDRGEASFDPDSVADGFDSSSVAGELVQKLDRIDSAIRDDGTVRVSERDILRTLQRAADRYDIDV